VLLGINPSANGAIVNIHDDDLPTCSEYLHKYRREVRKIRVISISYGLLIRISVFVEHYHIRSKGQLPNIITPYKVKSIWKGLRYDNNKLKSLGWSQRVPTKEGMMRAFAFQKML
jgi:hypothetical protein